MDIYDYAKYPSKENCSTIRQEKSSALEKIALEKPATQSTLLELFGIGNGVEMQYWVREFNNRAFDLEQNYTLLKSYYNAGIPDSEWYISPGKDGASVSYFPHFEDEHFGNLYWFSFYTESFLTRAEGIIDTIYHLVNVHFNLKIESKLSFRRDVSNALKAFDNNLYDYLQNIRQDSRFVNMNDYRNNIVHNFRPNQVDSGISKPQIQPDGSTVIALSVGNYTTSSEFLNVIHDTIDLLADITDEIKKKIV